MTDSPPKALRSHARSNRNRILLVAQQELSTNPDVTVDEIARVAGVARRTFYGHFPSRQTLLTALADEASQALQEAFVSARNPSDSAEQALARFTVAVWAVGDRYRMLLSLAHRDLGDERIRQVLAPARREVISILEAGQTGGLFSDTLPATALAAALEAFTLSLLESANANLWHGGGISAAEATLIAVGIPPARALHIASALSATAAAQ